VIKVVKIILEKVDIEKLIRAKYEGCEIKEGLADDLEVTISMEELPSLSQPKPPKPVEPTAMVKKPVVLKDGSIDANQSGLTLEPRPETVPGGAMGQNRGGLPTF